MASSSELIFISDGTQLKRDDRCSYFLVLAGSLLGLLGGELDLIELLLEDHLSLLHDGFGLMDEVILSLDKLILALFKSLSQLLLLFNDAFHCLDAPGVQLKAEHFLEAGVLIEEHVVKGLFGLFIASVLLAVHVVLNIGHILLGLEGVAAHALVSPVEDDALVDGAGGHGILHPADDLEAVLVDLPRTSDRSIAEAILYVVLQ